MRKNKESEKIIECPECSGYGFKHLERGECRKCYGGMFILKKVFKTIK